MTCPACTDTTTCPRCILTVRRNLNHVADLYTLLPAELAAHGAPSNGLNPSGRHSVGDGLPEALILLAPGTVNGVTPSRTGNLDHARDQWPSDLPSTPAVLIEWDNTWRAILGMPPANSQPKYWHTKALRQEWWDLYPALNGHTVTTAVQFLQQNLTTIAGRNPGLFAAMAEDIAQQRTYLQRVLHDRPQRAPVPCWCGRYGLERAMPRDDGKAIEWRCEYCHQEYDYDKFNLLWRDSGQAV